MELKFLKPFHRERSKVFATLKATETDDRFIGLFIYFTFRSLMKYLLIKDANFICVYMCYLREIYRGSKDKTLFRVFFVHKRAMKKACSIRQNSCNPIKRVHYQMIYTNIIILLYFG